MWKKGFLSKNFSKKINCTVIKYSYFFANNSLSDTVYALFRFPYFWFRSEYQKKYKLSYCENISRVLTKPISS